MNALEQIAARAAKCKKKIVLPEGGDARVLSAAGRVAEQGLAEIIVIGNPDAVAAAAQSAQVNSAGFRVLDSHKNHRAEKYAEVLMQAKKDNRITHKRALEQIRSPLMLGVCMVACGDADGCVAGAVNTTSDVLRAALQIIGAKSPNGENSLVSSFFIMQHDRDHQALRGTVLFADCAMVIEPNAAQLARIAMDTSDSAVALLGMTPRVALLSFSTAGSASHAQVDKVREAGNLIARQRPDLELMTEVQFDAAVIPEILRRKAPDIAVEAPANLFIFPDLQSANIGYKIAERIGGARAIGPILQGLNRPVNDLSRGCSVDDIVQLVAVTALQSRAH